MTNPVVRLFQRRRPPIVQVVQFLGKSSETNGLVIFTEGRIQSFKLMPYISDDGGKTWNEIVKGDYVVKDGKDVYIVAQHSLNVLFEEV